MNQPPAPAPPRLRKARWGWVCAAILAIVHGWAAWTALGGRASVLGPWPLAFHDHPIQEHNAWVTAPMISRSGMAAGYDPFFMAGYAKTLLSSPSSTVFEVVQWLCAGRDPTVVYKVTVAVMLLALPWLVMLAGAMFRLGGCRTAGAVVLFLLYVWTDGGGGGFPLNYATFGMIAYLFSVPLGLAVVAAVAAYLKRGGRLRWIAATMLLSLAFMEHVTSVLFLFPACLFAYAMASLKGREFPSRRHLGVSGFSLAMLITNSFWWFPALALRSTRSPGGDFFVNNEPVLPRMARIAWSEPPIQAVLLCLGLIGLVSLWKRDRVVAASLAGFAIAGLGWGYLAGALTSLNFLQPGRQTYALYAASSLLAGEGLAVLGAGLAGLGGRTSRVVAVLVLALVGSRLFGMSLNQSVRYRLGLGSGVESQPYLTSKPPPGFETILQWVKTEMKPGERLFYEEVGLDVPGDPDPFAGGRYSGLLPRLAGVEVIGGFYLHVGLKTNFTQIGEGKLFGGPWTRERFLRYAALYRPSGIVCWSREARRFCEENPDLVTLSLSQGRLRAGRVMGFEGSTIRGKARVRAESGRLVISQIEPDLDGRVVLRYHSVPGLRSRPPLRLEEMFLEEDPVAFLVLRPDRGQTETVLDLALPSGR